MFQVIAGTAGARGPRPGSPAGVLDPPAMSAKRENRLNDATLEKLRACNALPARRPQSQQKVASNCHGSPSSKDSSLTTSYKVLASWREVWRAVGTARTRTVVRVWWRRMEISSPTLIAWDDFAIFPLIETRCASQSFWASVRRAASRLALRKRSRRIQRMKAVGRSRRLFRAVCRLPLPPGFRVSERFRAACPFSSFRRAARRHWEYLRSFLASPLISDTPQPRSSRQS